MNTVVISRDQFVVEWNHDSEDDILPTRVQPVMTDDRKKLVQNEIHRTSFGMPVYFCSPSTSKEVTSKVKEENRLSLSSQVVDVKNSLNTRLSERAGTIATSALNTKVEKTKDKLAQEKLNRTTNEINETLQYFSYLPTKDVPTRDKKTVSMIIIVLYNNVILF